MLNTDLYFNHHLVILSYIRTLKLEIYQSSTGSKKKKNPLTIKTHLPKKKFQIEKVTSLFLLNEQ